MLRIMVVIMCAFSGHKYKTARILDQYARKVVCVRCGCAWAIHYPTQSLVQWDTDLERAYADFGPLGRKVGS